MKKNAVSWVVDRENHHRAYEYMYVDTRGPTEKKISKTRILFTSENKNVPPPV